MAKIIVLLLCLAGSSLHAQIRWEALAPVPADDTAMPVLKNVGQFGVVNEPLGTAESVTI